MPDVIVSRVANLLVEDGRTVALPGPISAGIAVVRATHGGVWVGGRLTLTPQSVQFRPNALNAALHAGATELDLPLTALRGVGVQRGIGTNIIVMTTAAGAVRARCFGARRFAEQIRVAADLHG